MIAKEVGDRAGHGWGYGGLGNIYLLLGEYQRAIEYSNKYLIIAKEVGDRAKKRRRLFRSGCCL